jgi:NTE family protein
MATYLEHARLVELWEGPVARAVHASCSVPGFVNPVIIDGRILGDGSLVDTVPVNVARKMGAEYVIGVDVFTSALRPRWGPAGMAFTALEILVERAGGGIDEADCLIEPKLKAVSYLSFSKRSELIRLGEEAARAKLPEIQKALGIL